MWLRRPRFTVRRLMVVVAIAGMLLGSFAWVDAMLLRSAEYAKKANQCNRAQQIRADQMSSCETLQKTFRAVLGATRAADPSNSQQIEHCLRVIEEQGAKAEAYREKVEYWASQREKYLRAARYPWRSVVPDRPEP